MRRADREIRDPEKIRKIILHCTCCRLGFCDGGEVYIVPLSFGYTETEGARRFYFHSAGEGRKLTLIEKTHRAGVELDCGYALHENAVACENSAAFQSVIGTGSVMIVQDAQEKREALLAILRHTTGKTEWTLPEGAEQSVCVFRLDVETISCKEHG